MVRSAMLSIFISEVAAGSANLRLFASDVVKSFGARTGDGSAGGYYFLKGKGEDASKYVVYLQGGGECRTLSDCHNWFRSGKADSSSWSSTKSLESSNVLDTDCTNNPDFCNWSKVFLPYVTADMWSGTRMDQCEELGGYYFSGHNILRAFVEDLKQHGDYVAPSHALITGSSAGGIGALTHTDFFADAWSSAVVKGAPECGFFYAGVSAKTDYGQGSETPASSLGFISEWAPYFSPACSDATGGNMSLCTDAHFLYPHVKSPLFIRENLFDTAKLGNCGFNAQSDGDVEYLKAWGKWMKAQLAVVRQSAKDGYFVASCLQHGGNFGFESSPVINGVNMRDALSNWYFEKGDRNKQYTTDDCGDLPCTIATGAQSCPHYSPSPSPSPTPISDECKAQLQADCPNLKALGEECRDCVRQHAGDLRSHGCPQSGAPVFEYYCDATELQNTVGGGHHVCDLSVFAREERFGMLAHQSIV